jgi:Ca2+-transporting ATPase
MQGVVVLLTLLAAFMWGRGAMDEATLRAFMFVALVQGNLALILSNRSSAHPVWVTLATPNRTLWVVTAITLALVTIAVYVPWVCTLFYFQPLPLAAFLGALACGTSSLLGLEVLRRLNQAP